MEESEGWTGLEELEERGEGAWRRSVEKGGGRGGEARRGAAHVMAAGKEEEMPKPIPTAPSQSSVFERTMMQKHDAMQRPVLRKRTGQAEGTSAETQAHPARPALIAVQKLDVMIAIVSSDAPRRSTP